MAELVAQRRASAAAAAAGPDRAPAAARSRGRPEFTISQEDELWRVRGEKPERWVRQTDFGNAEAVGYLADRLNRIGIEDQLLAARRPGRRRGRDRRRGRGGVRLRTADRDRRRDPQPARRGPAVRRGAAGRSARGGRRIAAVSRSSDDDDVDGRCVTPRSRAAHRVVVKVGSSSLTTTAGGIDPDRIEPLVDALAAARRRGREVVLVSSGAIAAGLAPLGAEAPGRAIWPPSRRRRRSGRAC